MKHKWTVCITAGLTLLLVIGAVGLYLERPRTALEMTVQSEPVCIEETAAVPATVRTTAAAKKQTATGTAATKPEDVRFLAFAPGQQRIHVYDKNWKNLFHYPGAALDNSSDGIQDARFGNLINNDDDEIYIGYLGTDIGWI